MTEPDCKDLEQILGDLDREAPGVPLLALGQTIFWDEPMKAGVALKLKRMGSARRFVAGVHDTDFFAKLPMGRKGKGKFKTVPHNDTTTRGLWSAAGEFSALFGSETVVTREMLGSAGLRVDWLSQQRPEFLDEATEAWGWRGVVSLEEKPPVAAELPMRALFPELSAAFSWASDSSLACLAGEGRAAATELVEVLKGKMCDAAEAPGVTLSGFYQSLIPDLYEFASNAKADIDTTATTELLRFNRQTCGKPRFELLQPFVDPKMRQLAKSCYDDAIKGSTGMYGLARFGTGAIPFELFVPGHGRGTIRLGARGAVISTPEPLFLSFKNGLTTVEQLAAAIEDKFGPNCVLVGKAVSLIGLLAREFVFVFHENASSYVKNSRRFHQLLSERLSFVLPVNPILRVRYDAWTALRVCCSWLRLPEPLQRPFGTEELCAPSFAKRRVDVAREQTQLLGELKKLRRPIDLIGYLDRTLAGSWKKLAEEYEALYARLAELDRRLSGLREDRDQLYAEIRRLAHERGIAEQEKGEQFRQKIFERAPIAEDAAKREELTARVEQAIHEVGDAKSRLRQLRKTQFELTNDPEIRRIHERRKAIELEAELKRARLIRAAVISSKGLESASTRPSAWWFPLVCPDGLWFRETIDSAKCYLEPLL
jgi:hypothetical protein